MGEKGSDAGQFFTPREVIRAMVRTLDPMVGERVFDPCAGTGGFLAQSAEYMVKKVDAGDELPKDISQAAAKEIIKHQTFYGREKENLIYPIGLANLILHGIDDPHIWHGNALTGNEVYGGLFKGTPSAYEVVLTNPPFGGKENTKSITGFDYPTSATEVLFLQYIIRVLTPRGRCGIVMPEGVLFTTNEEAFTKTKKKLVEECDLWCILSLPPGVFTAAGTGNKTNLLFFTRGKRSRPKQHPGLQAVDYFLWALQRFYEEEEDRFWRFVWPKVRAVHDLDDTREHGFGEIYTAQKPLTLEVRVKK